MASKDNNEPTSKLNADLKSSASEKKTVCTSDSLTQEREETTPFRATSCQFPFINEPYPFIPDLGVRKKRRKQAAEEEESTSSRDSRFDPNVICCPHGIFNPATCILCIMAEDLGAEMQARKRYMSKHYIPEDVDESSYRDCFAREESDEYAFDDEDSVLEEPNENAAEEKDSALEEPNKNAADEDSVPEEPNENTSQEDTISNDYNFQDDITTASRTKNIN